MLQYNIVIALFYAIKKLDEKRYDLTLLGKLNELRVDGVRRLRLYRFWINEPSNAIMMTFDGCWRK